MTLQKYSNLTQRIVAAVIGVPLIIFCIFYSPYTYWILFLAISILTQYEFYKLIGLNGNLPLSIYGTVCGAVLNALTFFIELGYLEFRWYFLIIPLLTITFFIKLYRKGDPRPFESLGYTFLGIIYVAVPFALVNELIVSENGFKSYLLMGFLLVLWVSDSGAYFAGRFFGNRKLFERISPKKTWEGFIGGALASITAAWIYAQYFSQLSAWKWVIIAIIVVITGTLGDLVESLFKRSIDIKDSGSIIPGHGGFLDRFDGLLLSMPFIVTFLKIFVS